MSNIATKLTYLNGTKQAIKNAINEDFEVIDDNTTFREYAEEISSNNAKYKDLIPKETKNATNTLDISNSSGLDKALVTLYGNTYQEGEPTPDTPIPVNVVSGDNTIDICGKNILNLNNFTTTTQSGITLTPNFENGKLVSISTSGTFSSQTYITLAGTQKVQPNKQYTLSGAFSASARLRLREYDSNNTQLSEYFDSGYGVTFTSKNNVDHINLQIVFYASNPSAIFYPMIEVGSSVSTYEPYIGNTYPIYLEGNVFKLSDVTQNKAIIGTSGVINNSSVSNLSGYIPVIENLTYILTFDYTTLLNNTDRGICYYDNNKQFVRGGNLPMTNKNHTITIPSGVRYVRFSYDKNLTDINFTTNTTPIELCKIGTYQDYIYKDSGKWYFHKEIGKITYDGTENWGLSNNVFYKSNSTILQQGNIKSAKSNYFQEAYNQASTTNVNTYNPDNSICGSTAGTNRFYIKCTSITSIDNFKTWLSTHNTTVYYVLATPTTTEITENNYPTLYNQLNNIKLFEGVNHITMTNESGLDVEFDIEYYKDWKLD